MKKTGFLFGLLFGCLLLLAGCQRQAEETNEYTVYHVNTEGTRLVESKYTPSAKTFDELMSELLEQLKAAPAGEGVSALKDGVTVNGYERGIDALRIDFSKEYYALGNTDEVLLRAAVVKCFSQIPGVAKVMITVDQEQLRDAEGQLVPAMDGEAFIDTKDGGINSYLYAKLTLYFPDESGKKLTREVRSLHYSSNMVLERVIIEQMIEGPKERGSKRVFTDAVKIQNIYIRDGVCTISFDAEVNKAPVDSSVNPEIALYAIVNSICETCDDITGVRFEIEGDNTVRFREEVELNQIFSMNSGYIEDGESSTEQNMNTERSEQTTETTGMTEMLEEKETKNAPEASSETSEEMTVKGTAVPEGGE